MQNITTNFDKKKNLVILLSQTNDGYSIFIPKLSISLLLLFYFHLTIVSTFDSIKKNTSTKNWFDLCSWLYIL